MTDFLDFLDVEPQFFDVDDNGLPDVHERRFINTSDSPVPDAVNGALSRDGDLIPDQVDTHIDVAGTGIDYRTYIDSGGDGQNDWIDPFSRSPDRGLSPELRHQLAIERINPFYS